MDSIPSASSPKTAVETRAKKCGVTVPSLVEDEKDLVIAVFAAASLSPEKITDREKQHQSRAATAAEVIQGGHDPLSSTDTERPEPPQISTSTSKQDTGDKADRDVGPASKAEANKDPPAPTQEPKSADEDNVHQHTKQGSPHLKNVLAKTPEKAGETDTNKERQEKRTPMQLKSSPETSLRHLSAIFLSPEKTPPRDSINLTSPSAMKGAVAAAKTLTKGSSKSPSPKPKKDPPQRKF